MTLAQRRAVYEILKRFFSTTSVVFSLRDNVTGAYQVRSPDQQALTSFRECLSALGWRIDVTHTQHTIAGRHAAAQTVIVATLTVGPVEHGGTVC